MSLLATLAMCLGAKASTTNVSSDRYSNIPERNVFGLRQPETEPEPAATNAPPAKLFLTGITTVLTNKLALLRVVEPAHPGKPPQEKPLMLAEGQREGGIEVLRINEQARSVEVDDSGTVMTLTFAKNGLPSASSTAAGRPSTTHPGATNYSPALARTWPGRGLRVLPTRTPRLPASGGGSGAGLGGSLTAPAESGGTQPASQPPTTPASTAPTNALTPAEQAFLQQLEQQAAQTNAVQRPLPPAPMPGRPAQMPQGANLQRTQPPLMPQ